MAEKIDIDEAILKCTLVILVVVLAIRSLWFHVDSHREWESFSRSHHCVAVEQRSHPHHMIYTQIGSPNYSGYRCTNGKLYWRLE